MGESLLRLPTVRARTGLSTSTIYARMAAELFPQVHHREGFSFWLESEIDAWVVEFIAGASVGPRMGRGRQPKKKAA